MQALPAQSEQRWAGMSPLWSIEMYEIGEVEQIITPDGVVYSLNNGFDRAVTVIGGRGMSGVEFITQQGYLQPYPVVKGWRLEPRTVTLTLTFANTERLEYWSRREELVNQLRFNRGGPFILRHIRQDGTQRDLYCHSLASPLYEDEIGTWETDTEEITLIAHDPLFKNPVSQTLYDSYSVSAEKELVFPITFPIHFEPSLYHTLILPISYTGTFVTYPVLQVNGPYTQIVFTNQATGAQVGLVVPILVGETRVIDLNPRRRTIVDGSGADRFNELLLPESNLTAFNIRPKGISWENSPFEGVPDGLNNIAVIATDASNATSVYITYQDQFVSL
jgi:hypothetical protein